MNFLVKCLVVIRRKTGLYIECDSCSTEFSDFLVSGSPFTVTTEEHNNVLLYLSIFTMLHMVNINSERNTECLLIQK